MRTYAKLMLGGLLVALLVTVGCSAPSEEQTIDQLKKDVVEMDSAALTKMSEDLAAKIATETTAVADLEKQVADAAADKVEALKTQLADAKKKLDDLTSKLVVVKAELVKKAAAVPPIKTD